MHPHGINEAIQMAGNMKRSKEVAPSEGYQRGAKKTWAFRVVALLLIPVLFFGILEAGLRLAGFGYPTHAILERVMGGRTVCVPNTRFTWRFFPRQISRGFDSGLVFEKEKPPRTFRIFTVGGSAAEGPPEPMHNFGRYLEVMLSAMYPGIRFEVNNAAITAINSHVVRDIVRDCAAYDPDLFIVYLGNNEVVGPFGPGTIFTRTPPSMPLIRANLALKSTRTGQLYDVLLHSLPGRSDMPVKWEGMAMFLDKQVRSGSRGLEHVYGNFEENLQEICKGARESGAAVILSSVGVNLKDCPPFASLHREGLGDAEKQAWQQCYEAGVDNEVAGRFEQAVARYLEASRIDDTYADLQFRLGLNYWNLGRFEEARSHYEKACEYDTLRFRADERINETIRRVAADREQDGIYFVDSVAAFKAASPHQIPGSELFYEHVHMNFKGNYTLARALIPAIQELLPKDTTPSPAAIPTEDQVAKRVAFTDFERCDYLARIAHDMMSKPPFTNQLFHDELMARIMSTVNRLMQECDKADCLRQYKAAVQAHPEDWRLLVAQHYLRMAAGVKIDLKSEEAQLRKVLGLCAYSPAYIGLGVNLLNQGRLPDARAVLNQLLELKPDSSDAYYFLGEIARRQRITAEALRYYRRAIELEPAASIKPYGQSAVIYGEQGEGKKAIRILNEALVIFSGSEDAAWLHYQLGYLNYHLGKRDKAREHMNTALQLKPEYARQADFQEQYAIINGS